MEQTPTISVVIPVYNAEAYLPKCLESVRTQTFRDWEAILIDDGSTDDSARICEETAEQDPRFRVIHKENAGVSTARNTGLDAARGEYVIFVDADDICKKTYFEKMVSAMRTYEPDLVISGFVRFKEGWEAEQLITRYSITLMKKTRQFLHLYTESRLNLFGVSVWAKMFRRDMIEKHHIRFDPAISYEEDCIFVADCVPHMNTFAVVGEALYRYRQMGDSLSRGYRKGTFRYLVNGLNRRRALLKEYGLEGDLYRADQIFTLVIQRACMKIELSDISRREKREDYQELMDYPETQNAVRCEQEKDVSRVTRWIAFAVRCKNVHLLALVMRLWHMADSAQQRMNRLRRALEKRRGK